MNLRFASAPLLLAAIAAPLLAAAQSESVISVNGSPIARSQYYKRMEVLPGVGRMAGNRFVEATPGFLTLQALIDETLMLQLSKQKGVEPSEEQITQEINYRTEENPNFFKAFQSLGFSMAELRYDVKVQLAEFNLTTMGINIADAQIQRFYEDEKKTQFTLPKRYRIRVITINTPELKKKVDDDLAAGKSFAEVATAYSLDTNTKYDGGLMGDIADFNLGASVKPLVESMKEGTTTAWMKGQNTGNEIKLFLEKILPSEVIPLNDQLKRKIRQKLMVDRGVARNDLPKMMEEMRKNAKLDFTGTPFDDQLKLLFGYGN